MALENLQGLHPLGPREIGVLEQVFEVALKDGEWRPQLVRNVGHKFAAHIFELFETGNIMKDHHHRVLTGDHANSRGSNREVPWCLTLLDGQLDLLRAISFERRSNDRLEIGLAQRAQHALSER